MTTEDKIKQLSVLLIELIETLDNSCTSNNDANDNDHEHELFDNVDKGSFEKIKDSLRGLV